MTAITEIAKFGMRNALGRHVRKKTNFLKFSRISGTKLKCDLGKSISMFY